MQDRGWTIQLATGAVNPRRRRPRSSILSSHRAFTAFTAFTLVEMLTVIVIIVLIIGLALPVFRSLSGSRSQEGATNQIAAMLGRAREAALAAQQPRGVAFYTDANTSQTAMVLVQPEITTAIQIWTSGSAYSKWK